MANAHAQSLFLAVKPVTPARVIHFLYAESFSMDEKEAEARPVMGTIFLVIIYVVGMLYVVCLSYVKSRGITWNHVNQTRACSKSVLGCKI